MTQLFLIRGVSGAGKTTLADQMEEAFVALGLSTSHIAADDFFGDSNGNYNFDVTRLNQAHNWCICNVNSYMDVGLDAIFVHNTFITEKEMKPYLQLAEEYNYKVISLIVENRHGNESVHDVPDSVVAAQRQRMRSNICL